MSLSTTRGPVSKTFSVAYRSGGTENATWTRIAELFATRADAQAFGAIIAKGGRHFLVYKTSELDSMGLPIGWNAETNLEEFEVSVSPYQTVARRKAV